MPASVKCGPPLVKTSQLLATTLGPVKTRPRKPRDHAGHRFVDVGHTTVMSLQNPPPPPKRPPFPIRVRKGQ